MKSIIFTMILLFLLDQNMQSQTATITLSSEKQTIRGYGGINHPVWVGDLTAAQRETAFGNADGQIGMSILRIWVSDNPSQWALEVATAKRAIALGAIVFASPWNPPSSMREAFGTTASGVTKYRLKYDQYAAYATHLNDFVTYMKNNGVDLYAISIQNEPDYAETWTWWTPTELVTFLKNNASAINCRIIAPESFQYIKTMSDPILNDAAALANMDILGAHLYGTSYANFPYPLFKQKGAGKELWMTEVYYPNSTANSSDNWPEALETGQHIHSAMVDAEFQTYVWWTIRRSYGPIKEDGTIGKRGYILSHYAKFVRPGYVRVDATATPATNVYLSAYKNGDDVVIVAVNKNTSAQTITLSVAGTKVISWDQYVTTGSKSMAKGTAINNTTGTFQVTLEAQSMTTLNGIAPLLAPTVVSPVNYCQNATTTALTATGLSLKWYTTATGGTALTSAPTPASTSIGSTTYYVSQTINGVESPRALITVTISATPTKPSVTTPINYMQNDNATQLVATGNALKWYTVATAGSALAAAPTPTTSAVGATSYYVSQTIASCESPRAQIDVIVSSSTVKIPLTTGWNWIGCPLSGSTAIATALSSIWSNVLVVKNMDSFYLSTNPVALNSLTNIAWGQGYLIKVKTDCVLDWNIK